MCVQAPPQRVVVQAVLASTLGKTASPQTLAASRLSLASPQLHRSLHVRRPPPTAAFEPALLLLFMRLLNAHVISTLQ